MMVISNEIQDCDVGMSGSDTEMLESDAGHDEDSSDGFIDSDLDDNSSEDEHNDTDNGNDGQEHESVSVTTQSENGKPKKKSKKNAKKNSDNLISLQRQRRLIHSLLKKAKIYEIRKLTRRINTLKAAKGTEEQRAKNQRKAERLTKEIGAIREFMIDQLTNRTIAIFKGKGEEIDNELWESCESPIKTNDMLQILSTKEGDHTASIAFLRMLSSKDIVSKFQRIAKGENLLIEMGKMKSKEAKKRKRKDAKKAAKNSNKAKSNDVNIEMKNDATIDTEIDSGITTDVVVDKPSVDQPDHLNSSSEKPQKTERKQKPNKDFDDVKLTTNVEKKSTKKMNDKLPKTEKDKPNANTNNAKQKVSKEKGKEVPKKTKVKRDDFFVDHMIEVSGDEADSGSSSEDEFSAPVVNDTPNPTIRAQKKNRMGQRDRKRLLDKKYGRENTNTYQRRDFNGRGRGGGNRGNSRGMGRGFSSQRGGFRGGRGMGRGFSSQREGFRGGRGGLSGSRSMKPAPKKEVDVNLHPSWQAKQRQKAQQSISGFAGTKITFDD